MSFIQARIRTNITRSIWLFGWMVVTLGIVLLLKQFGLVGVGVLGRCWPLLLVAAGVFKLIIYWTPADRFWGGFLLALGVALQLHEFGYGPFGFGQLWPLFIIAFGGTFVWHLHEARDGRWLFLRSSDPRNSLNIFTVGERRIDSRNFREAWFTALFGMFKADLTQAEMEGAAAVIEATAIWGKGEIRVPATWSVVIEGIGLLGAYRNNTQQLPSPSSQQNKILTIKGLAVLGNIEVRN